MAFTCMMTSVRVRRARLLGVAAAALLAELVWLLATAVLGLQLQAPAGTSAPETVDIGPLTVGVASLAFSLVGWAVLAGLERLTPHARRIWLVGALVALTASCVMPLGGTGISTADRTALLLMHLAVAAVVIPVLYRTSAGRMVDRSHPPARLARGQAV